MELQMPVVQQQLMHIPSDTKQIICDYGFPFVFHLNSSGAPHSFAQWIADHIQLESCDIIVESGVIHLGAHNFSEVIGLENTGLDVKVDFESAKEQFLSLMGFSELPTIKHFGKMLLTNDLADDKHFICFMVVFLSIFCVLIQVPTPASSTWGLCLFLVIDVRNYNWASFGHKWFIESVRKYQKNKSKSKALSSRSNLTLGGCTYVTVVKYLDFADFGEVKLDNCFPRTLVWKHDLIKDFARLDQKSAYEYGLWNVVQDICHLFERSEITLGPDVMNAAGQFSIAVLECIRDASYKLQRSTSSGKELSPIVNENMAAFSGCVQNCNKNCEAIVADAAVDSQATKKVKDPDDIRGVHDVPNEPSDAETVVVNSDGEQLCNRGIPFERKTLPLYGF
ncbi:hypothetical protein BRADI_5g02791v3 [Brachypodium distachyon]|uniref:Aminotransferase-like plant mobile domain-containing protein n=1 Tax=Brachypodium distachyon TaxID=15368 RepID=A0A0Q3KPC6_BRADI|nr:hypothetical protein BRADI_5g02791v3 [Brachypodium distachyon]